MNCPGTVRIRFCLDDIKKITVQMPRFLSKGYIQFVLKDNADVEIKGSNTSELDLAGIIELTKTSFHRSETKKIVSFVNFISEKNRGEKAIV